MRTTPDTYPRRPRAAAAGHDRRGLCRLHRHRRSRDAGALVIGAAVHFPRTYFAQDREGYFYETMMGPRSCEEIIGCILNGDYESCVQVYLVDEGAWKVWSHRIADEVLARWKRTDLSFTPKFLMLHHRDAVQADIAGRRTKVEVAYDRAEDAADRAADIARAA